MCIKELLEKTKLQKTSDGMKTSEGILSEPEVPYAVRQS
jgi:hypothetical protein